MLFDANAAGGAGGSSTYRMPEFIAVILSGEGSSGSAPSEYLEAGGDDTRQQASTSTSANALQAPILQPVDGKPRIDSILKWIEEGGVTGVLLLQAYHPLRKHRLMLYCLHRFGHSCTRMAASRPHILPSHSKIWTRQRCLTRRGSQARVFNARRSARIR